jgi:hypothetical protein
MKFNNMENKSKAEKKRIWKGHGGLYKKKDLNEWFKLYDETKLYEISKTLAKSKLRKVND